MNVLDRVVLLRDVVDVLSRYERVEESRHYVGPAEFVVAALNNKKCPLSHGPEYADLIATERERDLLRQMAFAVVDGQGEDFYAAIRALRRWARQERASTASQEGER